MSTSHRSNQARTQDAHRRVSQFLLLSFSDLMSSKLSVGRPYEKISSSTTLGVRPMSEVLYSPCNPAPYLGYRRQSLWPTIVCVGC